MPEGNGVTCASNDGMVWNKGIDYYRMYKSTMQQKLEWYVKPNANIDWTPKVGVVLKPNGWLLSKTCVCLNVVKSNILSYG